MNKRQLNDLNIPESLHKMVFDVLKKDRENPEKMDTLKSVSNHPIEWIEHPIWSEFAYNLMTERVCRAAILERDAALYTEKNNILSEFISIPDSELEAGARLQYENALALPFFKKVALMPDAHQGYGIPIGTVLSTKGVVIPNAVGVDIGCQMHLSILPLKYNPDHLHVYRQAILSESHFGSTPAPWIGTRKLLTTTEHFLNKLENLVCNKYELLKPHFTKFRDQIGTSGGGNHFVEIGVFETDDPQFSDYNGNLSIMTHSGSRKFGALIAGYYNNRAKVQLPDRYKTEFKDLAWLHANSQEGKEYIFLHDVAVEYAFTCHAEIHMSLMRYLRTLGEIDENKIAHVWNPHNYLAKHYDGYFTHRKGANDISTNLTIVPGSMVSKAFIVRGKTDRAAQWLDSCSHGAGRLMSRTKGMEYGKQNPGLLKTLTETCGVELVGAGNDEAPWNYKDINSVMDYQKSVVDICGSFQPKVVRMADDSKKDSSNSTEGE